MKKIKFKQLATFSLCCSLLVNSLTGVTAVAETMTIESSPTKGTVASEATTETEKKTKVEQTEQTKEAKEQQEDKETDATSQDTSEEENQKEGAQPTEATTSSLEANPPKIESRGIPLKTIVYPKVRYDFVDETGAPFTTPLSFSGNYQAHRGGTGGELVTLPAPYNKLSAQANGAGSYILSINNSEGFPLTPQIIEQYGAGGTIPNTKYRTTIRLDKLSIATPLKFVESIKYEFTGSFWGAYQYKGYNLVTGIFDNSIEEGKIFPLTETNGDTSFKENTLGSFEIMRPNTLAISSGDNVGSDYAYIMLYGFNGTNIVKSKMIYKVTRKQVTEKFVDGAGVAITPPTGFTQNKKTPMTSNNFTYTSAKALPDTYQANGKTYKFKGWYKGKTKPITLETTKTPSYAVTYDGNDDLNVVYEETVAAEFPEETYQFGFVNEAGKLVNPADINITYDHKSSAFRGTGGAGSTISFDTIATNQSATTVGNLKNVTMPATSITRPTETGYNGDVYSNFSIKLPRYYQSLNLYDKTGKINPSYPLPVYTRILSAPYDNQILSEASTIALLKLTQKSDQSYTPYEVYSGSDPSVKFPDFLDREFHSTDLLSGRIRYVTFSSPVYYHLTNRKVTENFVDASGAKLPSAPTGFTQGKQTVIDSDSYTFKQSGTLPESYKGADGKTYVLKGWYKGKTKPSTLRTDVPSYPVTFDDNDDLNVVYEEGVASVAASLKGVVTVMPSGGNQMWNMTIKNTGTAPLTNLKITPTANWSKGLANPTQLSVRLGSGPNQLVSVTAESWASGVNLGVEVPVGGTLTVSMTTLATGKPMEVLQAEVALSGNMPTTTVSDTVRIQGSDQEVTDPVGEGFISLPTFDFGQVGIAGAMTQHGLKKAADYYGNGTRNPFVRIKKSQPNWSLTAQLSQPKSAKDSLPTATRLLLGQAAVSKVDNYNLVTEMLNPVGTTPTLSLTANNSVTNVITNKQFTGNDVYNLDFNFNNVKLEVPANQGTKGEQYNATVTWNLVTGP